MSVNAQYYDCTCTRGRHLKLFEKIRWAVFGSASGGGLARGSPVGDLLLWTPQDFLWEGAIFELHIGHIIPLGFFVLLLKICFGSQGSLGIGCVYIIYNWSRYLLFWINSVKFKRNNYLASKGDCAFSFSESSIITKTRSQYIIITRFLRVVIASEFSFSQVTTL